jgi:hypothetical protein
MKFIKVEALNSYGNTQYQGVLEDRLRNLARLEEMMNDLSPNNFIYAQLERAIERQKDSLTNYRKVVERGFEKANTFLRRNILKGEGSVFMREYIGEEYQFSVRLNYEENSSWIRPKELKCSTIKCQTTSLILKSDHVQNI